MHFEYVDAKKLAFTEESKNRKFACFGIVSKGMLPMAFGVWSKSKAVSILHSQKSLTDKLFLLFLNTILLQQKDPKTIF